MKLYFMRHGETDWNKKKLLQGQTDIPLNDFGRELAYKTGEGLKDVPFELVITSPLIRARETAQIVMGDRRIPVMEDARIMEMCFGSYEEMCCKGGNFNIPDPEFQKFFTDPEHYRAPEGGEDFPQFLGRIQEFLQDTFHNPDYAERTILVSVHGAVLCAVLNLIRGNPAGRLWEGGVHKNCAVTVVNVKDEIPVIESENVVYYDNETEDW